MIHKHSCFLLLVMCTCVCLYVGMYLLVSTLSTDFIKERKHLGAAVTGS